MLGSEVGSAGDPYMKYVSDVLALTSDVGTVVRAMKLAEVQLGSCSVKIGKFCSFFCKCYRNRCLNTNIQGDKTDPTFFCLLRVYQQ